MPAALLFVALSFVAGAQSAQAAPVAVQTSSQLVIVVRQLIAAGDYDAARETVAAFQPDDKTYRFRVRYADGLIAKAQGRYEDAIGSFRSILAENPNFTFVRADLTQTLFLAKQDDAAKYQAQMLIAAGVDDRIGGAMRSIVGEIDSRRPVQVRVFASVLPSTNLNNGTDNQIVFVGGLPFVIDKSSRRESGVGTLVGGDIQLRHEMNDGYALVGTGSVLGRFYPSVDRKDLIFNATAGVEKKIDRAVVTLSAIGEQDFEDQNAEFRSYGGRLEVSSYVGKQSRIYSGLTLTRRDYEDTGYRDGWRAEWTGFYDYFISPSRFVRAIAGGAREHTQLDSYGYQEVSAGVGAFNEFSSGITVYAQATVATRDYDAPFAVFGVRHDKRYEGVATLTKRDFNLAGLAPQLTYSFTRNVSNSSFDDYTVHGVDLRLTKAF